MRIEFLGADHEVTGSCHYLSVGEHHILIDCGMQQGPETYENQEIPVNASDIDLVFVTHAHIDHSGLLPLLYARGFRGKIYATEATTMLCDIMLRDSAHIQETEAEWKNRKAQRLGKKKAVTPLYEMNDALGVMKHFYSVHYQEKIEVAEDVRARFIDAGHLLGSASIELWLTEDGETKKIVFSGDIGNSRKPLIKEPQYIDEADYVVMESTYGDRDHENPGDFAERLAELVQETLDKGGNLVIPAFSVGRTQEMLYFLRHIKEERLVTGANADFDVYMDSPLAVEATNVFRKNVSECFDEEAARIVASGKNPIGFPGLRTAVTSDESKLINFDMKPKVIISASGMCEAGRIRHHLKHNLWRPESTILFVGFQVPGTLGYSLLNGAKEVRLFGETVAVEARIENLPGISGHADRAGLLRWIDAFSVKSPQKVFVVHGANVTVDVFAKSLRDERGLDAYAPFSGDAFDLLTGAQIKEGSHIPKTPAKPDVKPASNVFLRLLAAGQRLMKVIEKNEGGANKDLAKFADQINALSDKWDR